MSGHEVRRPHGRTPKEFHLVSAGMQACIGSVHAGESQNMGTLAWAFTHGPRQGGNANKEGTRRRLGLVGLVWFGDGVESESESGSWGVGVGVVKDEWRMVSGTSR